MNNNYVKPELEIVELASDDVITSSGNGEMQFDPSRPGGSGGQTGWI